jgi:alpha-ribazole phosphatase
MALGLPRLSTNTTRLILIRHGEPDASVTGRCYGRLDPGLSAVGREQMRHIWVRLSQVRADAIYSSPSRRAIESACLRTTPPDALNVDERLREVDFGQFEGLTYDEIALRYPGLYAEWMTRPTEVTFPDGEGFAHMAARVQGALEGIRRRHVGETVVILSHAGINRIAVATALEIAPAHIFRVAQSFACMNVIDYIADEPVVRMVNATWESC